MNSPLIKLMNYGEYNYDHMIIFATTPMGNNEFKTLSSI